MLLCVVGVFTLNGQTVVAKSKQQTEQSLTKTATKTAMVYNMLPVFKSSKGKLFVVKHSKSGTYYKVYVELKK